MWGMLGRITSSLDDLSYIAYGASRGGLCSSGIRQDQ